jgi:hypothetical protein
VSAGYRSRLPIPEPAGAPRRDDEIDVAAAALRADEPAAPDIQIQIGTVPLRLLGGVEIGDAMAVVAPDAQQEVRPGRGAERRRTSVAFEAFPSHIPDTMQPDLSPEDYAAIAALLRDTIAADRFPMSPRIKRWRAILNKLNPPAPKPAPFPPLKPPGAPSLLRAKKQAWRR